MSKAISIEEARVRILSFMSYINGMYRYTSNDPEFREVNAILEIRDTAEKILLQGDF
jgi:hypothetical protein